MPKVQESPSRWTYKMEYKIVLIVGTCTCKQISNTRNSLRNLW